MIGFEQRREGRLLRKISVKPSIPLRAILCVLHNDTRLHVAKPGIQNRRLARDAETNILCLDVSENQNLAILVEHRVRGPLEWHEQWLHVFGLRLHDVLVDTFVENQLQ
jgi:hypothetical protein